MSSGGLMNGTEKGRLLLIANPAAGKRAMERRFDEVCGIFESGGYSVTAVLTSAPGEAESIAFGQAAGHDLIVSAGGDGTLYQVLNGMLRAGLDLPIGHIPCGSTNEFASAHKLPARITEAAKRILEGGERRVNVGKFGERYFLGTAAFGAFSWMGYATDQSKKNRYGYSAYVMEGLRGLKRNGPHHVRVIADGEAHEGDYLFGAVCATDELSRRVRFGRDRDVPNPKALELLLVRDIKHFSDAGSVIRSLSTGEYDDSALFFARADEIVIENEPGLIWSIGGESSGEFASVGIGAVKDGLRILGAGK